ncbi:sigma-70 family RNA polymerase sigma factor [Kitasatospora sp. NPDC001095]
MLNLTEDQITAAKANDLDAITAIVRETESLVTGAAHYYAKHQGEYCATRAEDLAQDGRVAVWRAIGRFEGGTVEQFAAYIRRTIDKTISDARRAEMFEGLSPSAAKDFENALRHAGGDPYAAEHIATQDDVMGARRMSPELAYAARLSWQGLDYLSAPAGTDDEGEPRTLAVKLAEEIGVPADLVEPRDIENRRQAVIRDQVHRALGRLSDRQRTVLKAGHGISPVPLYRVAEDDAELAAEMDMTPYQVQQARTKGGKRFAELYTAGATQW